MRAAEFAGLRMDVITVTSREIAGVGSQVLREAWVMSPEHPNPALDKHVDQACVLAHEFSQEPDQMGTDMATLWQKRAEEVVEAGRFVSWTDAEQCFVVQMCLQVAAIVYEAAKSLGGVGARAYGFWRVVPADAVQLGFTRDRYWINVNDEALAKRERELGRPLQMEHSLDVMATFLTDLSRMVGVERERRHGGHES